MPKIPRKLRIDVTQEHIDQGQKMDSTLCPVALALYAAGYDPVVGAAKIELWGVNPDGDDTGTFLMDGDLSDRIRAFDSGRTIAPFTIILKKGKPRGQATIAPGEDNA